MIPIYYIDWLSVYITWDQATPKSQFSSAFHSMQRHTTGHTTESWHIIRATCTALLQVLQSQYMKVPSNREDFKGISRDRVGKALELPNCFSAIDAKHTTIQALACRDFLNSSTRKDAYMFY